MIVAKFGFSALAFVTSGLAWLLLIGAPMMIRDGEKELDLMGRMMILTFRFMGVACAALAIGTWIYCFTI